MHSWIWPILVASGQAVTVYGLTFLHKMVQVLARTLEGHLSLLLDRELRNQTNTHS